MSDSLYRERSIRVTYRSSAPSPQSPMQGSSMQAPQQRQLPDRPSDDQYGDGLPSDAVMLQAAEQVVIRALASERQMREDMCARHRDTQVDGRSKVEMTRHEDEMQGAERRIADLEADLGQAIADRDAARDEIDRLRAAMYGSR